MDNACDELVRDAIMDVLKPLTGFLVALDEDERILGVLPEKNPIPFKNGAELVGSALIKAFKADFVRVFDGREGWDEIGYFVDGKELRRPYQVQRFKAQPGSFALLFPAASSFLLASPIAAYGSLEHAHEKTLANHAQELELMNRKLTRRSRRLKKAMDILEARNKQIISEMNLAVELQKSLLPKSYPDTDLISFTHRYIPLAMVGGDFFDIIKLSEERIGVMVSDVSGHGVAPAFITAMIRSSFDYLVPLEDSPGRVITRLNQEFSKIIDTDHFVSAFYAIFDFATMRCRYCNAGHPSQLIAKRDGGFLELAPTNPIIGMIDDYAYEDCEIEFGYGDTLCFFTDGVLEARDAAGALFGTEGIERAISSSMNGSADDMADRLITDIIEYMKDPYFEDDVTILIGQIMDSL
jgi:serine phosphatase RsbU (regulator of sigma subunit)